MASGAITVAADNLRQVVTDLFCRGGMSAEDAAFMGGCLVDAILHLRTGGGARTGNRPAHAEFDLGCGCSGSGDRNAQGKAKRGDLFHL